MFRNTLFSASLSAEVANNNNKDETCGKFWSVGSFHSNPAHAQTCFDWYCIYLRAFFLDVSADNVLFVQMFIQGSGCFHVYRSLRLESPCPASAPPSSDHSRKTFARCDRFLPSCAVTIIDVVRPVYSTWCCWWFICIFKTKLNSVPSVFQFDLYCWGFDVLTPSCSDGSIRKSPTFI